MERLEYVTSEPCRMLLEVRFSRTRQAGNLLPEVDDAESYRYRTRYGLPTCQVLYLWRRPKLPGKVRFQSHSKDAQSIVLCR